jgi:hypothetical protein
MSGSTYETTIRIPTARELALRVAEDARVQATASGAAAGNVQELASVAHVNAQALQLVLNAYAEIARPIAGTRRQATAAGCGIEMAMRGARLPVEIEVDPADRQTARVRVSFTHAHGLSCGDEDAVHRDMQDALTRAGLRPSTPTHAVPRAPAGASHARERGAL